MAGPTEAEIRAAAEAVARIGRVGGVAAKDRGPGDGGRRFHE
ncbi:MAG: hypothetical protein OXG99_13875 [Alphaproteobacteria bacterium]|nr:hypothetical protein [Alphaproteobacteria bacterium]